MTHIVDYGGLGDSGRHCAILSLVPQCSIVSIYSVDLCGCPRDALPRAKSRGLHARMYNSIRHILCTLYVLRTIAYKGLIVKVLGHRYSLRPTTPKESHNNIALSKSKAAR